MRRTMILLLLIASGSAARAQQQERKLVDRLLKPDTTLQNSAQNKRFVARPVAIEKKAAPGSFFIARKPAIKRFGGAREFPTNELATPHFHDGGAIVSTASHPQIAKQPAILNSTTKPFAARNAWDSDRKIASTTFAGSRVFLDKGKSQKAISQHDTPLTIAQVRELLNKNK